MIETVFQSKFRIFYGNSDNSAIHWEENIQFNRGIGYLLVLEGDGPVGEEIEHGKHEECKV